MIYIIMYLTAIVAANLLVVRFGPSVSVLNAFLFIGLDLTARDRLHETWQGRGLVWKMALLVGSGSALSWFLNRDAGQIALASFIAFALSGLVDTLAYHWLFKRGKGRWLRVNGSNLASAAVDSVAFPALAFGFPLLWAVMLGQFIAKILGGFIWSVILFREWKNWDYLDFCYHVRKTWCIINPLLQHRSRPGHISPDCVQWIMRRAPLIDGGVPFFLEPWKQPKYGDD